MSMRRFVAGAAGGLAIAFGAGHMSTLQAQVTSVYQSADQQLVDRLAAGNLFEARMGQGAQKEATNPSVKEFAQRMAVDHTSMQKQWLAVASKNGLKFNAHLTPQQVATTQQLARVPAAEFDRAYMSLMVQDHRDNVNAYQNERRVAHSPEVRALLDRDLVTIQNHLTIAQQTGSQVGAGVSGGVATRTDTTSAIPTIPPRTDTPPVITQTRPDTTTVITQTRTDTTPVITQNPQPDQRGEDRQRNEARQKDEERNRQGNVKADAEFIRDVDASHFLQVRLGRLAQQKGRDAEVKRFGKKMEDDHSAFQKEWSNMASRNGMNFKSGMGPEHRADLEQLEKTSGKKFDRAYMTLMIQNHNGYLNYWRKEGRAARSAPVRQLVEAGLPTLEEHLDMAKRIGKRVGVNADAALAGRRVAANR